MEVNMTVTNNSMMASQMYANKDVQTQSGASGAWTGASQSTTMDFSAIAQQLMSAIDTNKSGSLDQAEFSQASQTLAKSSGKTDTSGVDAAFGKMDSNGDGSISSDEMLNAIKQATAQTQTQKKHHHHQANANATDGTSQVAQANSSTQASSPANEMQKNFFNKIMAAYGSSTTTAGATTDLSA
ncbi:EF-hand domain-containing protein [bacterium]|nr:EF-hand domain-containing protein [bacterium]